MSAPPWKFEGFVTAAGNRVVEDWFWDDATDDERDAIRDRVNYLSKVKRTLWQKPAFEWFGDYGEIRKNVPNGALRVYGIFAEERDVFIFLHGTVKKAKKDTQGMDVAGKRLKRLRNGEGSTHEFDFEERPTGSNPAGEEGQSATGGIESGGGDCLPN